jgi:excisionase family DNA binding protein
MAVGLRKGDETRSQIIFSVGMQHRKENGKHEARVTARREPFLTIKDVAELLSVHPMTIYRLLKHGRLPGVRLGGIWRFSRSAIERWEHDQEKRTLKAVSRRSGGSR